MTAGELVAIAVTGWVVYVLGSTAFSHRNARTRREYVEVLRAFRWWMVPLGLISFALFMVSLSVLWTVPVLRLSWWRWVSGTDGSAASGQTSFHGWAWTLAALVIPIGLFCALPALARSEEVAFRYGTEAGSRAGIFVRQLKFGLIHCVFMGVPLAAGLLITFVGYLFRYVYLKSLDREEISRLSEYIDTDDVELVTKTLEPAPSLAARLEFVPVRSLAEAEIQHVRYRKNAAKERVHNLRMEGVLAASAAHATYNAVVLLVALLVMMGL